MWAGQISGSFVARAGQLRPEGGRWSLVTMLWTAIVLGAVGPVDLAVASPGAEPVLRVRESAGAALRGWPVWAGVPLPRGRLHEAAAAQLHEVGGPAEGAQVPVQGRVLGRWPDGSIRWLGLDWQTDLAPRQERQFALSWDKRVGAGRGSVGVRRVQVRDTPQRVEVDTGALQFNVPKQTAGFLADLRLTGRPGVVPTVIGFMDLGGVRHVARTAESVVVTETGPLRVRVEVRGVYAPAFRYVVRIDAYAGQPFARILHTFEQHGPERYTPLGQLALEFGSVTAGGTPSYTVGREDGEAWTGAVPDSGIVIAQDDNETGRAAGTRYVGRAAGWIDVHDASAGVTVVGRYFWQEYPQSFAVRGRALTYNLWAPDAPPGMIGMGAAKTHELVVLLHAREAPPPAVLEAVRSPLVAPVAGNWLAITGALRNAVVPQVASEFLSRFAAAYTRVAARAAVERWDDGNAVICADPARERPRRGFYGMLNWGDWNFPDYHDSVKGCDAWGNLEYDTAQVFALAYAATGEAQYRDAMVAAARHFMDVDRIYFQDRHPNWVGMNHPKNPLHFAFELGGVDLGHTWNEGLLSYFTLTGDERGLAAARGIADYLTTRVRHGTIRGNPRQWGWPQVALVAAYEATGHVPYRDAALAYARGGMAAHPPGPISHWKIGILADGLSYTHAVTGDPDILAWLEKYANAWKAQPTLTDPRLLPGAAYVARLTGDGAMRRRILERVAALQLGNWAKPLTIGGRSAFRILALLGAEASASGPAADAEATATVPAPAPTPWAPPSGHWEAPTPPVWEATAAATWPVPQPTATPAEGASGGTPSAQ